MYIFDTIVTYSRIDGSGKVPYHEILNYFQDCSTFHSESLGVGVEYMKKEKRAWVVLAYKVQIYMDLHMGDKIQIGTSALEFKKVFATRQYFIKNEDGDYVAKAETIWALIDTETRAPLRITEEDSSAYTEEKMFESIGVSRKMKFQTEGREQKSMVIPKAFIDTNGHVNNANYLLIANEYLPKDSEYNQIEIVYNKEAVEGESVVPYIHHEEDYMGVRLEDSVRKELLAEIKFSNI